MTQHFHIMEVNYTSPSQNVEKEQTADKSVRYSRLISDADKSLKQLLILNWIENHLEMRTEAWLPSNTPTCDINETRIENTYWTHVFVAYALNK